MRRVLLVLSVIALVWGGLVIATGGVEWRIAGRPGRLLYGLVLCDPLAGRGKNSFAFLVGADAHGLQAIFGIRRTLAYDLLATGHIRSVSLRRPGHTRGKRLFLVKSVRDFLNGQLEVAEQPAVPSPSGAA